jgi:hypothetical protein
MRRRRHQPDPTPPTARQPDGPGEPAYDWNRYGRHRLRAPDGAIIDLPLPAGPGHTAWVATTWPDPTVPGGWVRQLWVADPASGRGWRLPHQLAAGDIVEFGADSPTGPIRWYGIMDSYKVDRWATLQGPYPHPAAAHDAAQQLLALERYVPPLEPDPTPDPCRRTQRPRRPRHHRPR